MKRNRFSKALKHLKSTELDEKIQRLDEAPTNSIGSVYALNPSGFRYGEKDPPKVFYPDIDGNWPDGIPGTEGEKIYTRPAGYWDSGPGSVPAVDWDTQVDFSHSDTSTDGFIDPTTGTVFSNLPPDSRSFILGPLVDGYTYNHGYDDYTNIGYIQKDTRQFILLARIQGYWKSGSAGNAGAGRNPAREWGGESDGFYAFNENFTLAMAQWFRDQYNNGTYTRNVSYFYNGGQPQVGNQDPNAPSGSKGGIVGGAGNGGSADDGPYGSGGDPNIGTQQNAPNNRGPKDAGFPWGFLNNLGDAIGDFFGDVAWGLEMRGQFASSLYHAGKAFGAFLLQQQGVVNYTKDNPYKASLPPEDAAAVSSALNDVMQTIPRERWENLNGNDLQKINSVLNPGSGPTPSNPNRPNNERKNTDEYHNIVNNIGRSDAFKGQIKTDKNGNSYVAGITDNYIFTNDADASIAGAPALINFFANSLGAQDRMGDTPYEYDAGKVDLDKFNRNRKRYPNDPSKWDDGGQKTFKLKNMPIVVPLPEPGSKPSFNPGTNFAGGPIPKPNVKESKEVLTESRKRILREIKQPYKLPEQPKQKYKMNFKGKFRPQNTPDVTASKQTDEGIKAQNAAGQTWRTKDKHWSRYQSQERMNIIYDHIGHGNMYWDMIVNENQNKKGTRDRQIQEYLNIIAHEKAMLQEDPNYISPFKQKIEEQETLQADNDPLFKKVANKLKNEIDYPDKPSKKGYPDTPPPEMVNGFHPEYGNKGNYYDKLDPQSAEAMPPTGNAEIDAKVQKAKRIKKVLGKKG